MIKIKSLLKEYDDLQPLYEEFSKRLKIILDDLLILKGCRYLAVEERTKSRESLQKKLENSQSRYSSVNEVNDLSATRIITYVDSDITTIEKLIESAFIVTKIDVEERLETDKVGYRSHHWLISLPDSRLSLPEYIRFKNLNAELQIRTVLEHAWAQIGHDQLYKPDVILPDKIKRDFALLSGLLEIADNEFERISQAIETYINQVDEKTKKGDFEIPIDSVSLRSYFDQKFKSPTILKRFGPLDDSVEEIIAEFKAFDINTLDKLDAIIPKDLEQKQEMFEHDTNYLGVARNIMLIHDAEKYFKKAWKHSWSGTSAQKLFASYGIDLKKYEPSIDYLDEDT